MLLKRTAEFKRSTSPSKSAERSASAIRTPSTKKFPVDFFAKLPSSLQQSKPKPIPKKKKPTSDTFKDFTFANKGKSMFETTSVRCIGSYSHLPTLLKPLILPTKPIPKPFNV